ncbi:hypothetical protein ABW20_dc0102032 [Dactylellina cionopaga]|nr:hypothetical protein ABW20_dc0102032 [Dactylellina cionopaga]
MQIIRQSLLVLSGLLVCLASAAPVVDNTVQKNDTILVLEGPFLVDPKSMPPKAADLFKRTDTQCFSGATFNTGDYWALENSWWSRTDSMYMPAWTTKYWTWGTIKLCIANKYFSDNTHVYLRNVGDAMAMVGDCCKSDSCAGGISSIRGDSGLLVDVWSIPIWRDCKW